MPENFGVFAKLREIIRVSSNEHISDSQALAMRLQSIAEKRGSRSPFRRAVADTKGSKSFLALELGTILNHVRFADKIGLVTYRSSDSPSLPGFEPMPAEYSEQLIDEKVRQFLDVRGITMSSLAAALDRAEFKDIESLSEFIRDTHGGVVSENDLKKCVRILGDCRISLKYSRRKTYALVNRP